MSNLFDFNLREDDPTMKRIRSVEKFYELSKSMPEKYDQKYLDFAYQVFADKSIMNNFHFELKHHSESFVRNSARLWGELGFELQDVQYFKKPIKAWDRPYGEMDLDFVQALEIGSPLDIILNFMDDYLETGVDQWEFTSEKGDGVIFKKLDLPKFEKKINSTIYAHEVAHVELLDAGGGIDHYKNKDVIPIVIEELFADRLGVLELSKNNRFATLAQAIIDISNHPDMDFRTRIDKEGYLYSIIQAMSIANIYFSSNDRVKKEIVGDINGIFAAEQTTEEMLDKYDCNFKDIEPNVKVLKR